MFVVSKNWKEVPFSHDSQLATLTSISKTIDSKAILWSSWYYVGFYYFIKSVRMELCTFYTCVHNSCLEVVHIWTICFFFFFLCCMGWKNIAFLYLLQMFQLELFMRQSSESFPLTAAGLMAVDKDLALTVGFLWSWRW